MAKRGRKPKGLISLTWSPEFAYAIGLLTADGSLSKDGRHVSFVSKDLEQVETYMKCLGISLKVGVVHSGKRNVAYRVQFGDVLFYSFLQETGLVPNKSKQLGCLSIPRPYLIDFVRGLFDGDGCSYAYYDSVFNNSYRFYLSFASASPVFIEWIRNELFEEIGIRGHIDLCRGRSHQNLKYAKHEAMILGNAMYYRPTLPSLDRKRLKISRSLGIIRAQAETAKDGP